MMWHDFLKIYKSELRYSDNDLMSVMRLNKSDYANWFMKKSNVIPFRNPLI